MAEGSPSAHLFGRWIRDELSALVAPDSFAEEGALGPGSSPIEAVDGRVIALGHDPRVDVYTYKGSGSAQVAYTQGMYTHVSIHATMPQTATHETRIEAIQTQNWGVLYSWSCSCGKTTNCVTEEKKAITNARAHVRHAMKAVE